MIVSRDARPKMADGSWIRTKYPSM